MKSDTGPLICLLRVIQDMKTGNKGKGNLDRESIASLMGNSGVEKKLMRSWVEGEMKRVDIGHSLRERIKELNCLYGFSELIERHGSSYRKILQGVADLLPGSWQYPDIACSRVVCEDKEYVSANFKDSKWKQAADIVVSEKKIGVIEICYLKETAILDEGPFLREERLLIDSIAGRVSKAIERIKLEEFLRERVKELSCLYGVARLIEMHGDDIKTILQGVADLLPRSWQYPEIACARILFEGDEFTSDNFTRSSWKQAGNIVIGSRKIGMVEVYYLNEMPEVDEGPFLKEERLLIDGVSERIGRAVEHIRAEKDLEAERQALRNKNIALREVLGRIQEEKEEIGARIQANVDNIIMPVLYALENSVHQGQLGYVRLLRSNLEDLTSPFASKISKEFSSLSPAEIQICNLIKNGFSTKEIARLRGISTATINRHREHIRKKLELTSKKVNLATYLQSFMSKMD